MYLPMDTGSKKMVCFTSYPSEFFTTQKNNNKKNVSFNAESLVNLGKYTLTLKAELSDNNSKTSYGGKELPSYEHKFTVKGKVILCDQYGSGFIFFHTLSGRHIWCFCPFRGKCRELYYWSTEPRSAHRSAVQYSHADDRFLWPPHKTSSKSQACSWMQVSHS